MISLSDSAKEQLDGYFADKEKSALRIFMGGSCCGPKLSLALDEARENDEVVAVKGYTLLAEKSLLASTGAISIDMTEYGFSVDSENPLEASSCGSGGCGSGGCGSGDSSGCGCS